MNIKSCQRNHCMDYIFSETFVYTSNENRLTACDEAWVRVFRPTGPNDFKGHLPLVALHWTLSDNSLELLGRSRNCSWVYSSWSICSWVNSWDYCSPLPSSDLTAGLACDDESSVISMCLRVQTVSVAICQQI